MSKIAYTLRTRTDTTEIHIFLADVKDDGKCYSRRNAICQKAGKDESTIKLGCLTEQEARTESAKLGRKVCGTCVSHLYATY